MNAIDVLSYGHADVLRVFDGLPEADWSRTGVTTRWTPRDLLGHLASYERLLEEALREVLGEGPTPTLDDMRSDPGGFNERQVGGRTGRAPDEVMTEYGDAHERVMDLVARFTPERLRENGTLPWYGPSYSIDDLIVYTNYAHKREHCAQMRRFRMG